MNNDFIKEYLNIINELAEEDQIINKYVNTFKQIIGTYAHAKLIDSIDDALVTYSWLNGDILAWIEKDATLHVECSDGSYKSFKKNELNKLKLQIEEYIILLKYGHNTIL